MQSCQCGCGSPAPIATYTNVRRGYLRGNPVRFIRGHHKGRLGKLKIKVKRRTLHERAVKLVKGKPCAVSNEHCQGKVDAHHKDKNQENNHPSNIVPVCRSHHFLMDKRGLTVQQLKDNPPTYRTDKAGKRRYD